MQPSEPANQPATPNQAAQNLPPASPEQPARTAQPLPPNVRESDLIPGQYVPIPEETIIEWQAASRPFKKRDRQYYTTIIIIMFLLSHRLLNMHFFDRKKARRLIGSHYVTNFALVPIMLMSLNPWVGLLVFFPALGFISSNLILHGTILQPKTM